MIKYFKEVKAQNTFVVGIINTMIKKCGYEGLKDLKVRFQKIKDSSNKYRVTVYIGEIKPKTETFELQHNPFNIFWYLFSMRQIKKGTTIKNCKKTHQNEKGFSFYQSRKK